ncbi:MAG: LysR family transcriptional regulator [Pyramidobacter sp.]|nr:LysR family transcriptional regulator [Pyramidobacter sp.]
MDTKKCAALLRALETGSITAAAAELGYTPSGVSRAVVSLEEELGVPLLRRSRSGVAPTPECETLLPMLRELLRTAARTEESAARLRGVEIGHITIGTAYSAFYPRLALTAAEFRRNHPGVSVSFVEGLSSELAERVARGEADFCVISRRSEPCEWTPLLTDSLVLWLPASHPAAAKNSFPVRELESEAYIEMYPGRETDNSRLLAALGIKTTAVCSTSDTDAAFAMVEAGLGAALMNGLHRCPTGLNVVGLPLDPPQTVEIGAATPPGELLSPAAAAFASFAAARLHGNAEPAHE